jgi:hypothetical protein
MIKRWGGRSGLANGRGLVGLRWYRSLWEMARGAEKSVLAGAGGYSLTRLVLGCAILCGLECAPLLVFVPGDAILRGAAGVALAAALAAQLVAAVWTRRRIVPALLFPLAAVLGAAMALRAGLLAYRRGGLLWRGMLYPLAQLRTTARVRIG